MNLRNWSKDSNGNGSGGENHSESNDLHDTNDKEKWLWVDEMGV